MSIQIIHDTAALSGIEQKRIFFRQIVLLTDTVLSHSAQRLVSMKYVQPLVASGDNQASGDGYICEKPLCFNNSCGFTIILVPWRSFVLIVGDFE